MAGLAGKTIRVSCCDHLGEGLWSGRACFMTPNAQLRRIELGRLNGRIIGMLCQRSVTGFTTDSGVLALFLLPRYVHMTCLARLAAGEVDRIRGNFANRRSTVVPVTSKAARHQPAAYPQKDKGPYNEDSCKPKEVSSVPKATHRTPPPNAFQRGLRACGEIGTMLEES